MDRKRRTEEKQRRVAMRRDLRARGLDPDLYDSNGNLRPVDPATGQPHPEADDDDDTDGAEPGA